MQLTTQCDAECLRKKRSFPRSSYGHNCDKNKNKKRKIYKSTKPKQNTKDVFVDHKEVALNYLIIMLISLICFTEPETVTSQGMVIVFSVPVLIIDDYRSRCRDSLTLTTGTI